jgi:hypothetical protein
MSAADVPELRGTAADAHDLATGPVRCVRLRGGHGYDRQAVPRVRVVDRNGARDGEPPGVRMSRSELALILAATLLILSAWAGLFLTLRVAGR